jgi:hypothetical protein
MRGKNGYVYNSNFDPKIVISGPKIAILEASCMQIADSQSCKEYAARRNQAVVQFSRGVVS